MGWPASIAPVMTNKVDASAASTTSLKPLFMRFLNVLSETDLLGVMISKFAQSRRMTAKRAMAELRPARASPTTARNRMSKRILMVVLVDIVERSVL